MSEADKSERQAVVLGWVLHLSISGVYWFTTDWRAELPLALSFCAGIFLVTMIYALWPYPLWDDFSTRDDWLEYGLLLLGATLGGLFAYALLGFGWRFLSLLAQAPVLFGLVVLPVFAIVLFLIRLNWRACYGFVEAIVGLWVGINKIDLGALHGDVLEPLNRLTVVLCAGVYLIVRGLDNIHTGLGLDHTKPRRIDPVAVAVMRFLGRHRARDTEVETDSTDEAAKAATADESPARTEPSEQREAS